MKELSPQEKLVVYLVTGWLILLTFLAVFNFRHNWVDDQTQTAQDATLKANAERYENSIIEHDTFRKQIAELYGRTDVLMNNQPCKSTNSSR